MSILDRLARDFELGEDAKNEPEIPEPADLTTTSDGMVEGTDPRTGLPVRRLEQ